MSIHFQLVTEEQYINHIQRTIGFVSLALHDKRINVEHIGQNTDNKTSDVLVLPLYIDRITHRTVSESRQKLMRILYPAARHDLNITLTQ